VSRRSALLLCFFFPCFRPRALLGCWTCRARPGWADTLLASRHPGAVPTAARITRPPCAKCEVRPDSQGKPLRLEDFSVHGPRQPRAITHGLPQPCLSVAFVHVDFSPQPPLPWDCCRRFYTSPCGGCVFFSSSRSSSLSWSTTSSPMLGLSGHTHTHPYRLPTLVRSSPHLFGPPHTCSDLPPRTTCSLTRISIGPANDSNSPLDGILFSRQSRVDPKRRSLFD